MDFITTALQDAGVHRLLYRLRGQKPDLATEIDAVMRAMRVGTDAALRLAASVAR